MSFISVQALSKTYHLSQSRSVKALDRVSFDIHQGTWCVINGPSGSGKSTLLGLLSVLDRPTSGKILLEGREIGFAPDVYLARLRRERFGVVFQEYCLMEQLTAYENVAQPLVPMTLTGKERYQRAMHLLARVGLEDRALHLPCQLSGGEQQRVAFARALVCNPEIIFADEPISNVDLVSAGKLTDLFKSLRKQGCTLVIVSHDPALSEPADVCLKLDKGKIII